MSRRVSARRGGWELLDKLQSTRIRSLIGFLAGVSVVMAIGLLFR